MAEILVRSAVIYWQEWQLEITDKADKKYIMPLDKQITVTMVGYPDREVQTMVAQNLEEYMGKGYIIEKIAFEDDTTSKDV